jgi:NAD(P)-dependent dehydrogenase (short-subunit alcohol dehydrogenase family)
MFSGRSAIVLGASARRGSGWTIAEHLARAGAQVAIAARSMEGLKELAGQTGASPFRCDAGVEEDVRRLVSDVSASFG